MPASLNKNELVQRIIGRLRDELQVIENATEMANEEVLPADDIAESQREPRAVEVSLVVDNQTKVARELKDSILAYETLLPREFLPGEPVALFALVHVESAGERHTYFIGPKAGGMEVAGNGHSVLVLTPQSPLARRLLGRNLGDTVQVEDGARSRSLRITGIA